MIRPASFFVAALCALLVTTLAGAPARAACDIRYEADVALDGPDRPAHRLILTLEGRDCRDGAALWRMYDPTGRPVWAAVSGFDELFPPEAGEQTIDAAMLRQIYRDKTEGSWLTPRAELPEWPASRGDAQFDFVDSDGIYAEVVVPRHWWNEGRQRGGAAWCWAPGNHYARCFWTNDAGRLVEAFVMAW